MNRHIDQWKTIETPEIKSHVYGQLVFGQGVEKSQCEKNSLFNNWCCFNYASRCKVMNFDDYLTQKPAENGSHT